MKCFVVCAMETEAFVLRKLHLGFILPANCFHLKKLTSVHLYFCYLSFSRNSHSRNGEAFFKLLLWFTHLRSLFIFKHTVILSFGFPFLSTCRIKTPFLEYRTGFDLSRWKWRQVRKTVRRQTTWHCYK